MEIIRTCPMCDKEYDGYPAISRTAGKEEICPQCGVKQALQSLKLVTAPAYQMRSVAEWAEAAGSDALSFIVQCYQRHCHLDWGDLDNEDKHSNDVGLTGDDRLFSSYNIPTELQVEGYDTKIWIITEWDRSATTILLNKFVPE